MYDLIIIGSGPAGLTASIYASCFHLKHLVISAVAGGQMINAPDILNYPGFPDIHGKELTKRMVEHVKERGGEIIIDSVVKINHLFAGPTARVSQGDASSRSSRHKVGTRSPNGCASLGSPSLASPAVSVINKGFEIETQTGKKYQSKAIILATGTERRKLNIPGEVEYTGKGVHYCATCERMEYGGKICAVIGGGNSAVQAAVELSDAAKKVYIVYRGTELRGESVWLERIKKSQNIEVIYSTVVEAIVGNGEKLTGVKLQRTDNKEQITELQIDKIFIEIGGVPGSALIIPLGIKINETGHIEVNEKLGTNVPGIFACGDLVSSSLSIEQIATAVGLGARAAASAFAYIKGEKTPIVWGKSQIRRG